MTEHRSRLAWPLMPNRPPIRPRRRSKLLAALFVAVVVNAMISALLFAYVIVLKDNRDTEQERIRQQIVTNNCALMDGLPAGEPLDRLRSQYHCGPGLAG